MPDLRQRLRALDSLDVPDVMERAQRLGPKPPVDPGPSPARRIAVVAFALLLAVASLLYVTRAFDRSQGPLPASPVPTPQWSSRCAWTTTILALPADEVGGRRTRNAARLVAGTSMDDLWVMASQDAWIDQYLVHFDGQGWTEVPLPSELDFFYSGDMVAATPDDLWVLAPRGVARFDGTTWRRSNFPGFEDVDTRGLELLDLEVVTPDDAWVAGNVFDATTETRSPLIMHWDGQAWSRSYEGPERTAKHAPERLVAVSAWSSNDVWVAGTASGDRRSPSALHWDGTTWTHAEFGPKLGAAKVDPFGLVAAGPGEALLSVDEAVVRWNGNAWVDTGFGTTTHPDVPIILQRGTTGVWAKVWNSSVARWDGEAWRQEPLKGVYAYGMSVIDDSAIFVGAPLRAKIYDC